MFDDSAAVHHGDGVAHSADDSEIVGDEEIGKAKVALQVFEQIEDLRLDRHVERGYRFVADDQLRIERDRTGDPDPLPLSAGELVRVRLA